MKNIGSKIKTTASIFFVLAIIGSVIGGIIMIGSSVEGLGILLLLGGPLAGWLIFMMIYGFGQLVENSDYLRDSLAKPGSVMNSGKSARPEKNGAKSQKQKPAPKERRNKKDEAHDDSNEDFVAFDCPECKTEMTVPEDLINQDPVVRCPECNFEFDVNDYYKL